MARKWGRFRKEVGGPLPGSAIGWDAHGHVMSICPHREIFGSIRQHEKTSYRLQEAIPSGLFFIRDAPRTSRARSPSYPDCNCGSEQIAGNVQQPSTTQMILILTLGIPIILTLLADLNYNQRS
jgi:hypothetical protein